MKRVFITGITGQDGSYLAELLLEFGYEVWGGVRRTSSPNFRNIRHIEDRVKLIPFDLTDSGSITRAIKESKPNEVYNLAAQSFVKVSWDQPVHTADVTGLGTLRVLEAIREIDPSIKFYQASSSEMFGNSPPPQSETTLFKPRSPYACAKVFAHQTTINYRESYDMFACCGILFNHESSRRGVEFVTQKIVQGAVNIKLGKQQKLLLGNLNAKRDWGFAKDYVNAMWRMLQVSKPDDYVIATGVTHTVAEFCEKAFGVLALDWKKCVEVDASFIRPAEVNELCGDASKAKKCLEWCPEVDFDQLVEMMVHSALENNETR